MGKFFPTYKKFRATCGYDLRVLTSLEHKICIDQRFHLTGHTMVSDGSVRKDQNAPFLSNAHISKQILLISS